MQMSYDQPANHMNMQMSYMTNQWSQNGGIYK